MQMTVNLRNRAWLLGMLHLANRAGLKPLPKRQLHSLVFLANCLAPIYGEAAIESRVIKYRHGPFYPDAQWDLDRMLAQGLVQISHIRYEQLEGEWWMEANYHTTRRGDEIYRRSLNAPLLGQSYRFLVELINAFVSIDRGVLDEAPLHDALYSTPGKPNWAALVFEKSTDNVSAITADAFSDLLPSNAYLSPKERVDLYLRYLGRMALDRERLRET